MRKLLFLILALFLVIGLVGAGTYAWFQDTETSEDNVFTAGTLVLEIRDHQVGWGEPVIGTWTAENMAPGDEWEFDVPFVKLRSVGSLVADHLEITADYTVSGVPEPFDPDSMGQYMEVTWALYEDGGWRINLLDGTWEGEPPFPDGYQAGDWQIQDVDGDGRITFADLRAQPLDNLPPPMYLDDTWFEMSVRFSEDAGNEFQGASFNLTMIFTLNQDSSQ